MSMRSQDRDREIYGEVNQAPGNSQILDSWKVSTGLNYAFFIQSTVVYLGQFEEPLAMRPGTITGA